MMDFEKAHVKKRGGENTHTVEELHELQALPLRLKIMLTKARIRDWVDEFGEDGVYVSFSGGKDSTVLLDLVRRDYPNVPAVFVDTGLEFPEIRQFVKLFDNVTWLKPKMNFREVIEKYGYPMISKETAFCYEYAKKYIACIIGELDCGERKSVKADGWELYRLPINTDTKNVKYHEKSQLLADKMFGWKPHIACKKSGWAKYDVLEIKNGEIVGGDSEVLERAKGNGLLIEDSVAKQAGEKKTIFSKERYKFLLDSPFNISSKCCEIMKKSPTGEYGKETGRKPITAQMASESRLRTNQWIKRGCNAFDGVHKISNPMSFWCEQDVLLYLRLNHDRMLEPLTEKNPEQKHPWASVYGEIRTENEECGQLTLFDAGTMDAGLFDLGCPELHTTGEQRTGCVFCGFGCSAGRKDERFVRLSKTHPKLYEYVMGGRFEYSVYSHDGSEIDLRHVDEEMLKRWVKANEDNKRFKIVWKSPPKGGLGYKDIIDWINKHGGTRIQY